MKKILETITQAQALAAEHTKRGANLTGITNDLESAARQVRARIKAIASAKATTPAAVPEAGAPPVS